MTSLQERITEALRDADMKPGTLARIIGISRATVSLWVKGQTQTIDGDNLIKAAHALGVNPRWLGTGEGGKRISVNETTPAYGACADLIRKIGLLPQEECVRIKLYVDALISYTQGGKR